MSITAIDDEVKMELGGNKLPAAEGYMEDDLIIPEESRGNAFIKKVLTSPTGSGSIDGYMNHPLNFEESRGMARLIRGLSGIFDNLDYAAIDIVIGLFDIMKSKRGSLNGVSGGSDFPS